MERLTTLEITTAILGAFTPVWIGLAVILVLSWIFRGKLGLYGKLFGSPIGMFGLILVLFWILTAIFADQIAPYDALDQVSGMKNKKPGWPVRGLEGEFYWLGGDNLARDVFSRLVLGSRQVMIIAPAATLFAFMVGITLGLPAGFRGGRTDTVLTFLANLVLAFPVILLFFLLVTPEIRNDGTVYQLWGGRTWIASVPNILALVLFLFPIVFFLVLWTSKYSHRKDKLFLSVGLTLLIGGWAYIGLVFNADPLGVFYMDPNLLNIFVSVVFVNAPTVFRIVRGVTIDIKTRDYVAAAQTRGERPWYIMLWEILPNARGPLIVDFCLRIGYTTILLGTLGFFGLGVSPESPDWGMTINEGRKLLSLYPHLALPPALALMSLVLGLNLLADGLREESLKD
ncbi:ABC transporter permease [Ahrensia sp. R2A130]|uniref:ABC transporter permease n=1 Tax=Ahrensia sp. R2A130 TaxID=744979 RepID=UPI0001E0D137|nr:ABC transporter permease [Ahrensia sp. R2A130]EFL87913.1 binding-protein-dependent transport systems inner membrane component [Ahrensia sp. R2A130]